MRLFGIAKTNENENTAARLIDASPNISLIPFIIALAFVCFLVLWGISVLGSYIACGSCAVYTFWGFLGIAVVGLISALGISFIALWHWAQKQQYMNAFQQHYSYRTDKNGLAVAYRAAQSLASADMDTYSPTMHQRVDRAEPDDPTTLEDVSIDDLSIVDLFNTGGKK